MFQLNVHRLCMQLLRIRQLSSIPLTFQSPAQLQIYLVIRAKLRHLEEVVGSLVACLQVTPSAGHSVCRSVRLERQLLGGGHREGASDLLGLSGRAYCCQLPALPVGRLVEIVVEERGGGGRPGRLAPVGVLGCQGCHLEQGNRKWALRFYGRMGIEPSRGTRSGNSIVVVFSRMPSSDHVLKLEGQVQRCEGGYLEDRKRTWSLELRKDEICADTVDTFSIATVFSAVRCRPEMTVLEQKRHVQQNPNPVHYIRCLREGQIVT
jgi:hypothetical protein